MLVIVAVGVDFDDVTKMNVDHYCEHYFFLPLLLLYQISFINWKYLLLSEFIIAITVFNYYHCLVLFPILFDESATVIVDVNRIHHL